jgi:hypothetical protein
MISNSKIISYTFLNVKTNSMRTYFCNDHDYAYSRLVEEVGGKNMDDWHLMPDYV